MTLWSHPGGYQRNRQESDDLNTKGSIQISYLRRQNDDGEVVMTISQGWGMLHIVPIQMPYKTRAKCPHRELAVIPNSHPNSLARDKLINSAHPGPARLARALELFSVGSEKKIS